MKALLIQFITILIIIGLQSLIGCKTPNNDDPTSGIMQPVSTGEIVEHTYYSLSYSEEHEGAIWVFYHLTPEHLNGDGERKDNFKFDPLVSTGSATLEDYKGSGYDRGHLCPAAAMTINQVAMDESFYMSNISPQHPSCNRGRWKSLESKVRDWVLSESELFVVSGPIFMSNIDTIGENAVTVPGFYYKVLYNNHDKMIGFILPNEKCPNDLVGYVVPIDSIESLTGIDFFSIIEDEKEERWESTPNITEWVF